MALTSRFSSGSPGTSALTYTSGAFTPAANSRLFVFASAQKDTHSEAFDWAVSGGGLSWTEYSSTSEYAWAGSTSYAIAASLWYADVGGSPASMTVAIDPGVGAGSNVFFITAMAFDVDNYDTGAPFPQTPAPNGADFGTAGDSNSGTLTLGSAPTNGNYVIGLFAPAPDVSSTLSTPSGYSAIGTAQSTPYVTASGFYRTDTTTTTITSSDLGEDVGAWAGIAFELKVSGGGGGAQLTSKNGIAISTMSAFNGIAKASVASINGLTI